MVLVIDAARLFHISFHQVSLQSDDIILLLFVKSAHAADAASNAAHRCCPFTHQSL